MHEGMIINMGVTMEVIVMQEDAFLFHITIQPKQLQTSSQHHKRTYFLAECIVVAIVAA